MSSRPTRRQLIRGAGQSVALAIAGGLGCNNDPGQDYPTGRVDGEEPVPSGAIAVGPVSGLRPNGFELRNADLPAGDGRTSNIDVYLRKSSLSTEQVIAVSSKCTHLGCGVDYVGGAQIFTCPCHAGAFDFDGNAIAGPPTEPLERFATEVVDGTVYLLLKEANLTSE